ncbi:ankyrin repeat-containing domain protein [Xylaria sp. FL0043]|nr:ankyrin repeat-containing domain protein [Xylaria sp. FL0043]
MQLLDLPQELVIAIFEAITLTRSLVRLLRLRLVSRHFKFFVEHVIIYARPFPQLMLDTLIIYKRPFPQLMVDPQITLDEPRYTEPPHPFYLELLARRTAAARQPSCSLGRIRHTAVVLCEMAGDTGHEALVGTLKSLCHLSCSYRVSRRFNERLFSPKFGLAAASSDNLEADLCVAAIYLGRRAHVESLIAQGWRFCDWKSEKDVRSGVFGSAFTAATLRGDVPMMRLLLSSNRNYSENIPYIPYYLREQILDNAASYGYRDAFDFAIDNGPFGVDEWTVEVFTERDRIRRAMILTPIVDNYRRGDSILDDLGTPDAEYVPENSELLYYSAVTGRVDMVRYFLDSGISRYRRKSRLTKALRGAVKSGKLDMVSLLLQHGADPNPRAQLQTPLVIAVKFSSISIARLLLESGANPDVGIPAPILMAVLKEDAMMFRLLLEYGANLDNRMTGARAMAIAQLWGFESMIDMLAEEGVKRGPILKHLELAEPCVHIRMQRPFGGRNPKYCVPRKPRSYAR